MAADPSDADLRAIEAEPATPWDDPLEALFTDAQLKAPPKRRKAASVDPRQAALHAEAELRAIYTNPDNWQRTRGLCLIDAESGTLLGNFSEYVHKTVPATRKLLREHQPIAIDATEAINGYLGAAVEQEIRGQTWEKEHQIEVLVQLDELMVEAPYVKLTIRTRFSGVIQARLAADTQFACPSGNVLLQLPAGTDIWRGMSVDSKIAVRKAVEL